MFGLFFLEFILVIKEKVILNKNIISEFKGILSVFDFILVLYIDFYDTFNTRSESYA